MNTYLVLRRNALRSVAELERAASRSAKIAFEKMPDRVRWIRSYVLNETGGTLGMACVLQGRDADAIREHASEAQLPCNQIFPVAETIVLEDDPPR